MISTIILSDLHLGSNNIHHGRLHAFLEIIETFDRVILNGDFLDDHWDYEKTMVSEWKPLFDLLKTKETIYLFGNHDVDSISLRSATKEIINEYAETYHVLVHDRELIIMHGHTVYPRLGGILYKPQKSWWRKILQKVLKVVSYIVYPIILIVRFFIERHPQLVKLQRPLIAKQNEVMKQYAKGNLEPDQILVCGHSHLAEFSPEQQFINEGANAYERVEYLSIRDNNIELVIHEL